ncbi:glycosyltransferase family 4 protein [Actinomycetospora sp. OC33-EN08]|uniref:Glycosyltransferase family 4 protein n=1 Tax=Actinomycetospora aurantiaca TaxID=3129233 RepID=A0ABU8MGG1_9PSEU
MTGLVGARRVTVFSEARFGRGPDGRWRALHRAEAAGLDRFRRAGFEVDVVARGDLGPCEVGVGTPTAVRPLPNYVGERGLVRALPRLLPALVRSVLGAERVVVHLPGPIGGLAATICRVTRRRYAAEVVGEPVAVLQTLLAGRRGRVLARLVGAHTRWTVRGAAATAYVTREALQRLYPPAAGTPSVGVSDIRLAPEEFADAPRTASTTSRLVTVGHQDQPHKGHDVLLRAIARLRASGLDVAATIVGGGRLHDDLRALRDELGLRDVVRMAGVVNDSSSLRAVLDEADVFVLPSRAGEGLPRALVEAMARGLPAVATDLGGVSELLDPSCVVLPRDEDALVRGLRTLLYDPEHRDAMARRNLLTADRFRADELERRWSRWAVQMPDAR